MKPFKLVSIDFSKENEIEATIILKRKDQEIDELRLFCQDVLECFEYRSHQYLFMGEPYLLK